MSRPTDWSALSLSSDPIPGDPAVVLGFGNRYSDIADMIKRTAAKLNAIGDGDDGEISKYVDKLRDTAKEVSTDISKAHERYAGVASAMQTYASPLSQAQSMADAALTKARGASDSVTQANSLHHHYTQLLQEPGISDDDKTRYTQLQQQNSQDLSTAQGTLHQARQDLQDAINLRNSAAGTAIDAIKDVSSSGGLNDSGWTKFWEKVGPWVDKVLSVVSALVAIATIVALFIPGIGEIVALIGLIVAIAIVINAVCQMSAGTKSIANGIFEIAMAVVPLGVGRVLGSVAKAAGPGIEDAAAVTYRTSQAAQSVQGVTKVSSAAHVSELLEDVKPGLADKIILGPKTATQLARMNELSNMPLTAGGASTRIAGMVGSATKAYKISQVVEPIYNATGGEYETGHLIEGATEKQEMVGADG